MHKDSGFVGGCRGQQGTYHKPGARQGGDSSSWGCPGEGTTTAGMGDDPGAGQKLLQCPHQGPGASWVPFR